MYKIINEYEFYNEVKSVYSLPAAQFIHAWYEKEWSMMEHGVPCDPEVIYQCWDEVSNEEFEKYKDSYDLSKCELYVLSNDNILIHYLDGEESQHSDFYKKTILEPVFTDNNITFRRILK